MILGFSMHAHLRFQIRRIQTSFIQPISEQYGVLQLQQRVDTTKREMFSQKSVRRFVGDSSAFVMGAMFLASALNRGSHPREILKNAY